MVVFQSDSSVGHRLRCLVLLGHVSLLGSSNRRRPLRAHMEFSGTELHSFAFIARFACTRSIAWAGVFSIHRTITEDSCTNVGLTNRSRQRGTALSVPLR